MSGAARADAGPASVASQPAAASSAPLAKAVTEGEATIAWRDRFFEDFSVGDTCRHRQARTVSSHDNAWFTLLTQNPAPLHLDVQFARQAGFDRVPLNSTLTLALVTGQSVADLTPHVMTNLGWSEVRLPAPAPRS